MVNIDLQVTPPILGVALLDTHLNGIGAGADQCLHTTAVEGPTRDLAPHIAGVSAPTPGTTHLMIVITEEAAGMSGHPLGTITATVPSPEASHRGQGGAITATVPSPRASHQGHRGGTRGGATHAASLLGALGEAPCAASLQGGPQEGVRGVSALGGAAFRTGVGTLQKAILSALGAIRGAAAGVQCPDPFQGLSPLALLHARHEVFKGRDCRLLRAVAYVAVYYIYGGS